MDRGAGGGAMNEAEHFRRAKAHLEAGDRATAKGQEHYVSAGQHLRAIKDLSPDQATFLEKVEAKLGLGKSRTYELLAIADGTKTVEDSNAGAAKRMRDMRARRNSVRNVTDKPATTTEEPATSTAITTTNDIDAIDARIFNPDAREMQKRREQFLRSAGAALAYGQVYDGPVDAHIIQVATAIRDTWAEMVRKLQLVRKLQGALRQPAAPENASSDLSKEEDQLLGLCGVAPVDEPIDLPPRLDRKWAIETLKTGEARLRAFRRQIEASIEPAPAQGNGTDAQASQDDDGDSEEVCWRRGLLNRATEAAGGALYEDWSSYVVDDELVAKAEQAAVAWTSTAQYLRRLRDAQSGRTNVVTTFAADLAERAENAIVESPAAEPAEPADVIEPDNGDGVLVWSSDQG
jgi:hypothetical protein